MLIGARICLAVDSMHCTDPVCAFCARGVLSSLTDKIVQMFISVVWPRGPSILIEGPASFPPITMQAPKADTKFPRVASSTPISLMSLICCKSLMLRTGAQYTSKALADGASDVRGASRCGPHFLPSGTHCRPAVSESMRSAFVRRKSFMKTSGFATTTAYMRRQVR